MQCAESVFVVSVCIISGLTTLNWTANKGLHPWEMLILPFSKVISYLWFLVQHMRFSRFDINMSTDTAIVQSLFM